MMKRKLHLKKLEITDNNPLIITLSAYRNGDELLKRKNTSCFISAIDGLNWEITDKEIIKEALSFFFSCCDPSCSPQCLWETNSVDYSSLLLDVSLNHDFCSEKTLENVLEKLIKITAISDENIAKNLEYIAVIEVAYPTKWIVEYAEKGGM